MKRDNQNGDDDSQNEGNNGSGGGGGGNNGGGGRPNKRFRGNDETIRLLIPSRIAGAIIGKGGQHINRLRAQYKATINVEDCQGPERTVHVSAEFDNAISIVEEMLKNFDEEDEYDVRMLIHQSLAGCVIGKGGSKIKEIRDKIGCRILKVFSNVCPQSSDRIVQCVGKADQAVESIREILDLVKEVPIKGPVQNYDPINYDDLFADKYGGFGDNGGRGGGGNGGGGGNFRDGGGRFDRRGGGDDRGFDRRDGGRRNDRRDNNGGGGGGGPRGMRDRDFIDPWAPNQGPMGGNNFGGNSGNGFGNNFGGNMGGGSGGGGGAFGNQGGNMGSGGGGGNMGGGGGSGAFGNQGGNMGLGGNSLGGGGGGGGMGNNMGGGLGGGFNSGMGGPGNNMSGNMGGGNMGPNNGGGNFGGNNSGGGGDDKNTTQVTIPKDLAGAIIGKAGGRIRRIRMESNAFITIDEPLPGSTDRIITITGSPKQIQMAQYLLQQSVHEHRRQY